jgi:hypothetical protein
MGMEISLSKQYIIDPISGAIEPTCPLGIATTVGYVIQYGLWVWSAVWDLQVANSKVVYITVDSDHT